MTPAGVDRRPRQPLLHRYLFGDHRGQRRQLRFRQGARFDRQ
jgi:hypothetical protein